jgi:hypothetical protein
MSRLLSVLLSRLSTPRGRGGRRRQHPGRSTHPRPGYRLCLEHLEDRCLPSTINWVNEGQASDNFATVFGSNAGTARAVVQTAITEWENVITNFNQTGNGDNNHINVTISMNTTTGSSGGVTNVTSADANGKPTAASISLGATGDGVNAWFLDPTLFSSAFLGTPSNAFTDYAQGGSPAAGRGDLLEVITHELGHAMGFSSNSVVNAKCTDTGVADTLDGKSDYYLFRGTNGFTALLTGFNSGAGGGSDAKGGEHFAAPGASATVGGTTYYGADDLMTPYYSLSQRKVVSREDAYVLRDAYGYTVNDPAAALGTFYAVLNPSTGKLIVRGRQDAASSDTISLDLIPSIIGPLVTTSVALGNPPPGTGYTGAYSGVFLSGTITSIEIDTGAGTSVVNLLDAPNVPITINSAGSATVNLGTGGNAQGVLGPVTLSNSSGPNTKLSVDDSADSAAHAITLTNNGSPTLGKIIGLLPNPITYAYGQLGGVAIKTSAGNDTVAIENTVANDPVTITLGGGTDRVNISPVANNLDNIQGNVTVHGGLGFDTLSVFDNFNPVGRTYTLTALSVTRGGSALITYGSLGINSVVVEGGSGANVFNVQDTEPDFATTLESFSAADLINVLGTTGALTVYSASDNVFASDTVNVGSGGSLQNIRGSVSLTTDIFSSAALNVDDSADPTGRLVTMSANTSTSTGTVAGLTSSGAVITYPLFGLSSLTVRGGSGNNTYNVLSTPGVGSMTVNTGGGTDTVNINATSVPLAVNTTTAPGGGGNDQVYLGTTPGGMQGYLGAVTIFNSASRDQVFLDDSADTGGRTVTISSGGVTGLAPAAINFTASSVSTLLLAGGSGTNAYTVSGTPAATSVTLSAGSGTNNTLVGPNLATTWQITGSNSGQLTASGLVPVTFTGVANLTGGSGGNYFAFSDQAGVSGTIDGGTNGFLDYMAYTTPVTVNLSTNTATGAGSVTHIDQLRGGAGDDSLTGNTTGATYFFASPGNDTVTGLAGSDNVQYGTAANNTWSITGHNAGALTFAGSTTSFTGVGNLIGGTSADDFVFADGASVDTQIDGGENATLDYSAYSTPVTVQFGNLGMSNPTGVGVAFGIQHYIGGGATNTLVGPNVATTWNVTAQNAGNLNGGVSFSGFQNLTGGTANDTFVLSDGAGVDGNIDGGGGSNSLDESAYSTPVTVNLAASTATGVGGSIANLQRFLGSAAGGNSLNGPNAPITWLLGGTDSGRLSSGFSFTNFGNLTGGSGNDSFLFANGASVSGSIDGGGGTNALSYATYSTSVVVDLQTGTATGVGGSIANIQNVTGGSGGGAGVYNILVGNGGNVLTGGDGRRNLLIAGPSASTLIGGNDDDILIGGTTAYDTEADQHDLIAIMAYWSTTSDSYATRVSNLLSGIGVPLLDATMVTDNGGGNVLTGYHGGAGELNLYYGLAPASETTDYNPNIGEQFIDC